MSPLEVHRKHRVLLIAPQPFFASRGTPINVRALATSLTEIGYEVDLLVYPIGADFSWPGLRVFRCARLFGIRSVPVGPSWRKLLLDLALCCSALKLSLTNRYDIFHGVEEGGFVAGALGYLRGRPYVYDMDSCIISQLESSGFVRSRYFLNLLGAVERFFIRRADAVLTVCRDLSDKVRDIYQDAPIFQIEDFPLEASLKVDEAKIKALRSEFGLSTSRNIVYTGNFESYQGIDLLLHAFAALKKQSGENLRLVLVGGNPRDRQHYSGVAERLGISDGTIFTGERPESEMGAFMALAQVLVSPRTIGANTPLKLYGYMASNRPIVATKILSHTQVLDDSSAFLAEPQPEAFAKALKAAIDSDPGALTIQALRAERARHLVETRYSKNEFVRRLRELYQTLSGTSLSATPAPAKQLETTGV